MLSNLSRFCLLVLLLGGPLRAEEVEFTRDVRPILSKHCFKCHGPDEGSRESGLRLDVRDAAIQPADSGSAAIVPSHPEESELLRRVLSDDESEVMPPADANLALSASQKETLRQWIASGAKYQQHWSFIPPVQVSPPAVKRADWPRNSIDHFVLAKLEAEGLSPAAPADRRTLARRVSLDLIGLPPTLEEVDAFVNDSSPDAYEKLVDRLLASPHYGERWARPWLDLARYADTNGYEKDRARSIWPYRDWVINALNADMPYDQFTIEQIAGDMLPNSTPDQRIATGFHRNTMINEEGGIDPLEFRFYAMTDRVATTSTVWLGLTLGCAQCHTHKYDPIPHHDYYSFMALLNNANELEMPVERAETIAKRAEIEQKIASIEADLPNRFPIEQGEWAVAHPTKATSANGAILNLLPDHSVLAGGNTPETDTYTIEFDSQSSVSALRLQALVDPSLPSNGPGRTPHGNFVLSEIKITAAPLNAPQSVQPIVIASAEADFAQDGFPIANSFDGNTTTGWAIHGPGQWNVTRNATFHLQAPVSFPGGTRWTVTLDQQFGAQHTLGHLMFHVKHPLPTDQPIEAFRQQRLNDTFATWTASMSARTVPWRALRPEKAASNLPKLTVQEDDSVLVSGDQTKRDVYDLSYKSDLKAITAVRLEVLPDDELPNRGPGRVYYEGSRGDFFMSQFKLSANGAPIKLRSATQSFASGGNTAAAAIDDDLLSGWSIDGGQGRRHVAVFQLAEPTDAAQLDLQMVFERYYAAGLGRFRISVTDATRPAEALDFPAEVEQALLLAEQSRSAEQNAKLLKHFLAVAPELAPARVEIDKLRAQIPADPTTLIMQERPQDYPRPTHLHHRGEFLQPRDAVEPNVLSVLPPLPSDKPRNRLALARWLVDPNNPLVGRVTMNRQWALIFGRGLVRTTADFGFQGELPSHPELLDWLAVEFANQGWSMKKMHRLIVTSATYQQSSEISPEALERDPDNRLLARGPRVRLEAELIRDSALQASGLLSSKLGGPSVYPPQPASVTTEGTYGQLAWNTSQGEDRYRRGLYTFAKRSAPYAMFATFDAPSGEFCTPRREISNSPLQALTMLNDTVVIETSQALGRIAASSSEDAAGRAKLLFKRCLIRLPSDEEVATIVKFYEHQRDRLRRGELDAAAIGGQGEHDPVERAAWTTVARALFNVDDFVVKK